MYSTRYSKRVFYGVANSLFPLNSDHSLLEEEDQYDYFKSKLVLNEAKEAGDLIETDHGIWYPKIIRFKDLRTRNKYVQGEADGSFWKRWNVCISTGIKELKVVMSNCGNKPIVVILGQRMKNESFGHAHSLVLYKDNGSWKAIMRNAMPFKDAVICTYAYEILKAVSIPRVKLIPELPAEEDTYNTDCVMECYKVVGEILDGTFLKTATSVRPNYCKEYSVPSKKQIR